MALSKKAVILVGHGGLPRDIPSEIVEKFMRVHKTRIKSGNPISTEEIELDRTIRKWQRSPENDPYKTGLENLASYMQAQLPDCLLKTAYNEFCHPAIEDAVDELVQESVSQIILVTTMITRGGSHSESEIPAEVQALSLKYPDVDIQYAWPFNIEAFSLFLSDHIKTFDRPCKLEV
jgi:sirohydrochlorin cobaltochelatase